MKTMPPVAAISISQPATGTGPTDCISRVGALTVPVTNACEPAAIIATVPMAA